MQIALEPNGGLDQVQDNSYLHNFAKQAASSGIPVFLRFANEMNDVGSEWGGDPKKYIEKFQLVARVMHNEAPNVAMCWAPNDWPFGPAAEYYPGDEYVDWIGVSAYPPYLASGVSEQNTKWSDRIKYIYDAYADRKPIYLAEGAPIQNVLFETTDVSWVGAKDLKEFYDEISRRYPAVKAVFYWDNQETWGAARKCMLSGNQNILNAYKSAIACPYFLSGMNASSPVIFIDLADSPPLEPRTQKISTYVGNHRLDTAKVVYYINGKYAAEVLGSPYEALLDLSAYAGQNITIQAEAYDSSDQICGMVTDTVSLIVSAYAGEYATNVQAYVDGNRLNFDNNMGYPIVRDNRIFLPVKATAEAMDATVNWLPPSGVQSQVGNRTVLMTVGSKTYVVNGETKQMEVEPFANAEIGRTYVPARYIAEGLGYVMEWRQFDGVDYLFNFTKGQTETERKTIMDSIASSNPQSSGSIAL